MAELDSTLLDLSGVQTKSPDPQVLFIQTTNNQDVTADHQETNHYGDIHAISDEIGSSPTSALKLIEKSSKNRITMEADYIGFRSANSLRASDLDNSTNHETTLNRI